MIEKWMKQIRTGEISPDALGLGEDKEKALVKLKNQLDRIMLTSKKLPDK